MERRRERYVIIYVWKIVERKVPNFSHQDNGIEIGGISWYHHIRLGRKCRIPIIERGPFQQARNVSLARKVRLYSTACQNPCEIQQIVARTLLNLNSTNGLQAFPMSHKSPATQEYEKEGNKWHY